MQQATAILSGIALVGIIALTSLMMFVPVPLANHDFIVAALSSLATYLSADYAGWVTEGRRRTALTRDWALAHCAK